MQTETAPNPDHLAALRPWLDRAEGMVDRRIADAKQHAAAGSLPTATARLRELTQSLSRHVSDARASFYRSSFAEHARAGLDPDVHQLGVGPTPEGEAAARRATIMNRSIVFDLVDLVSDAEAGLQSATLAGGGDYLETWAGEHRDRIESRVRRELSDSQIAIFHAVGTILVKPEFR
jgi:hypothetical protein